MVVEVLPAQVKRLLRQYLTSKILTGRICLGTTVLTRTQHERLDALGDAGREGSARDLADMPRSLARVGLILCSIR